MAARSCLRLLYLQLGAIVDRAVQVRGDGILLGGAAPSKGSMQQGNTAWQGRSARGGSGEYHLPTVVFCAGTPGPPVATSALGGSFHAVPVRVHLPFMSVPTDGTAPKPILHEAKAGGHASVFLIRAPDEPVRPSPPTHLHHVNTWQQACCSLLCVCVSLQVCRALMLTEDDLMILRMICTVCGF